MMSRIVIAPVPLLSVCLLVQVCLLSPLLRAFQFFPLFSLCSVPSHQSIWMEGRQREDPGMLLVGARVEQGGVIPVASSSAPRGGKRRDPGVLLIAPIRETPVPIGTGEEEPARGAVPASGGEILWGLLFSASSVGAETGGGREIQGGARQCFADDVEEGRSPSRPSLWMLSLFLFPPNALMD